MSRGHLSVTYPADMPCGNLSVTYPVDMSYPVVLSEHVVESCY